MLPLAVPSLGTGPPLGLNDQATRVEFTGRIVSRNHAESAIDSAKLQAISTIISRMGAKPAQDIQKGMELRY
jgi:hypothetical protein